ncbi:hypothetical protein P692DRAFT_201842600 [Suillus brevipes Sb2]|nr:hypothetical protein P692DRAFT_201842600 [Suillus brevipes Sb2]
MHIAAINTGDLLIPLWRGSFRVETTDNKSTWAWAVLKKEIWKAHDTLIADATPYLPGSFNHPPHNPTEKISSGYKAWEWLLYLDGMAPATLYCIFPEPYWSNFCHLAWGLRIMQQYHISHVDLIEAHSHLLDFADEFEEIYYQSRINHLHFVRPWVHSITHIAPETVNKGPPICSSQWTMERTIGNLTQEIRLHNASVNAIKAIIPSIEPVQSEHPKWLERIAYPVRQCEVDAILQYLSKCGIHIATAPSVMRWAHLCLPNGQVAHSAWKENRIIAEVLFYFNMSIHGEDRALALISEYGPPHADLLQSSFQMVFTCCYRGDVSYPVLRTPFPIPIVTILSFAHAILQ